MTIRAIVFDIGGVLEIKPPTGWAAKWEANLQLHPGEIDERLGHVWHGGSLGIISEAEVEQSVGAILGLEPARVAALMQDMWAEYLGTLNVELTKYFASLRPRYQTAILSNSFVGARDKEHEHYQFGDLCDLIIYSHEEGLAKPDRRIFELTCRRLGVQPHEIVFLDDYAPHITAARELGIHAILFQDTAQAIAEIEERLHAESA